MSPSLHQQPCNAYAHCFATTTLQQLSFLCIMLRECEGFLPRTAQRASPGTMWIGHNNEHALQARSRAASHATALQCCMLCYTPLSCLMTSFFDTHTHTHTHVYIYMHTYPCCDGRDPRLCLRCGCHHLISSSSSLSATRCAPHTRASKPRDGLRFNICCSPREWLFEDAHTHTRKHANDCAP
jgi:hypothetical protein